MLSSVDSLQLCGVINFEKKIYNNHGINLTEGHLATGIIIHYNIYFKFTDHLTNQLQNCD